MKSWPSTRPAAVESGMATPFRLSIQFVSFEGGAGSAGSGFFSLAWLVWFVAGFCAATGVEDLNIVPRYTKPTARAMPTKINSTTDTPEIALAGREITG